MEINLIIRELLAKHNYISLPGIGSFTQKYEPAYPSADGKSFIPPKQTIDFDTARTFNDEAIENYLIEKLGISHSEAANLLKVYIDKLNYDLDNGKPRVFENVGELFKNKKGRIRFEQATNLNAALSTYGLKNLEVEKTKFSKPIKAKEPQNESNSKVLVGLSIIIVAAALAATFIFIPDFRFWEKNTNTNQETTNLNSDTIKKSADKGQTELALTKKDSTNTKIDQKITQNSIKKTALSYEEPKVQDNRTFYIVVGSFSKFENAQKLSTKFKEKGFNPEIIQGNNMFRVSINKTTDKNRALAEFNKFRAENPNESVWLLGI